MFWIKLISLIFGAGAAIIFFGYRLVWAFKDSAHDYFSVPANKLSDSIDGLKSQVKRSSDSQRQDHRQILGLIGKIRTDQEKINKHSDELQKHARKIKEHTKAIAHLKHEKADKIKEVEKKRGNYR